MAFILKNPPHSFVQFGLEQFEKSDCENCLDEIHLPITEASDIAFQLMLEFDSVAELDTAFAANDFNNIKLFLIEKDCITAGAYTPTVFYDFSTVTLLFDVYRVSSTQVLLYWSHGLTPIGLLSFEQTFRFALQIPIGSTLIEVPSNCFFKSAVDCFTSVLEYSCDENSYGFIYCVDDIPNIVRLPTYISKPQFTDEESIYVKSDGAVQVLKSVTKKEYEGKTDYLNQGLHEKLKIAITHDNVNIKSQYYSGGIRKIANYEIEWQNFEPINNSPAKYKVLATPYFARNSNCQECDAYVYSCDIHCVISAFHLGGSSPKTYQIDFTNVGLVPVSVLLATSLDGITWSAPISVTVDTLTQKVYGFGENFATSHYVKITPVCSYLTTAATPTIFHYSTDYAETFTASTITSTSFVISTAFSAGVTFDVSLDGGATYVLLNQTSTTLAITGLTTATTYQVVRRMKSIAGIIQVLPVQAVTTI